MEGEGEKKTREDNQFRLYTKEKKVNKSNGIIIQGVREYENTMNKISDKQEGKGGVDIVNTKDRIRTKIIII